MKKKTQNTKKYRNTHIYLIYTRNFGFSDKTQLNKKIGSDPNQNFSDRFRVGSLDPEQMPRPRMNSETTLAKKGTIFSFEKLLRITHKLLYLLE